jgi:pantoate--beta-alanine ligase
MAFPTMLLKIRARILHPKSSRNAFTAMRSLSTDTSYTPNYSVFGDVTPLRDYRRSLLLSKRTVGLVPTMGALHAGHLSLVRQAAAENTDIFISIFVNPTQFGVHEDLATYPKTWDADIKLLEALDQELANTEGSGRLSCVFAPTTKVMYPTLPPTSEIHGKGSFVTITPIAELLEGASRPVFFRGVATVCMKLFNIVQPERVYFGQKDIQQTIVIKRMVRDFHLNTDVRIGATQREEDGLAMSSRNVYLGNRGARRREVAIVLSKALRTAEKQYIEGKRSRGDILWVANDIVDQEIRKQEELAPEKRARVEVDYISLADPDSLEEIEEVDEIRGAILSGAIKMLPVEAPQEGEDCGLGGGKGVVRLIDNIVLRPEGKR